MPSVNSGIDVMKAKISSYIKKLKNKQWTYLKLKSFHPTFTRSEYMEFVTLIRNSTVIERVRIEKDFLDDLIKYQQKRYVMKNDDMLLLLFEAIGKSKNIKKIRFFPGVFVQGGDQWKLPIMALILAIEYSKNNLQELDCERIQFTYRTRGEYDALLQILESKSSALTRFQFWQSSFVPLSETLVPVHDEQPEEEKKEEIIGEQEQETKTSKDQLLQLGSKSNSSSTIKTTKLSNVDNNCTFDSLIAAVCQIPTISTIILSNPIQEGISTAEAEDDEQDEAVFALETFTKLFQSQTLDQLTLENFILTDEVVVHLAEQLTDTITSPSPEYQDQHFSRLKRLSLNSCNITDIGGVALANMLRVNNSIEVMELRNNRLSDKTAEAITKALKMNSTLSLLNMDIQGNDDISVAGHESLDAALLKK